MRRRGALIGLCAVAVLVSSAAWGQPRPDKSWKDWFGGCQPIEPSGSGIAPDPVGSDQVPGVIPSPAAVILSFNSPRTST